MGNAARAAPKRAFCAGLSRWASSQPGAAVPGYGATDGEGDGRVSGLRGFLPVAVESGVLYSITR